MLKENVGNSFTVLVVLIKLVRNIMIKPPETITEKIKQI